MKFGSNTRALWLRARYRESQYEGEACLLTYDDESFGDLLVSGDIKEVFERRASTANIFIAAPYLNSVSCRDALKGGIAVQRAMSYLSGKTGNVYLVELDHSAPVTLTLTACELTWDATRQETQFGAVKPLNRSLCEGWLFDLFDSNEGLVVAPAGIHFRKSSRKHSTTFLRAANSLTSSAACGLLALLALERLGQARPKRLFVDTAPLLSLAYALARVARAHGVWPEDIPARSFSSYGGLQQVGRLSTSDVLLISATTSGSLAQDLVGLGARAQCIVTLYFLGSTGAARPDGVLCDLGITADRSFGYQPTVNFEAKDCTHCKAEFLLVEFEGDQFLLQQRQHRLMRVLKKTQSVEARTALTELHRGKALQVTLRSAPGQHSPVVVDEALLLSCAEVRADFIRLLRRFCPQPLGLLVRMNISNAEVGKLAVDAGIAPSLTSVKSIDWSELPPQPLLPKGAGVLVIIGCLSSQTQARSVNASLRSIVNEGNVAYLSALTLASSPEQYQDLKMFLGFGQRGPETFTYREARRLAIPDGVTFRNSWEDELQLLDRIASTSSLVEVDARRHFLSSNVSGSSNIFLPGKGSELAIRRDFVYLDTTTGTTAISQADVFAVVLNLWCVARSHDRELAAKPSIGEIIELSQSVYGHVLVSPGTFLNYNDSILKASVLRAAKPSELMYEVDDVYSAQMAEIVHAEIAGWQAGTGDALPEMLLALATGRLRLRETDRLEIRGKALEAALPPWVLALATAIPF